MVPTNLTFLSSGKNIPIWQHTHDAILPWRGITLNNISDASDKEYIIRKNIKKFRNHVLPDAFNIRPIILGSKRIGKIYPYQEHGFLDASKYIWESVKDIAHEILYKNVYTQIKYTGLQPSYISFRPLKDCFGLCINNHIFLDPSILFLGKISMTSIIKHELCHLVEKDHNHNFSKLSKKYGITKRIEQVTYSSCQQPWIFPAWWCAVRVSSFQS